MAAKKTPSDLLDIDDLLELTNDDLPLPPGDEVDVPEVDVPKVDAVPALTPEQEEILALRAQVSALKDAQVAEPVETPEQREIRELKAALAAAKGINSEDDEQEFDAAPAAGQKTILIHFVRDGLVVCGQTWYRGQELEFVAGSVAHKQQFDLNGNTWLDLADDIDAQFEKYGDQFFASGPWRGRGWRDASIPDDLDAAEKLRYQSELQAAAEKENRRGRAAPIMR